MADGELTLKLDDETARRLRAAAEAAGLPMEDFVTRLISQRLEATDDWVEDERIIEEMDRSGVSYSVAEGMAVFDAAMESYLANKP